MKIYYNIMIRIISEGEIQVLFSIRCKWATWFLRARV